MVEFVSAVTELLSQKVTIFIGAFVLVLVIVINFFRLPKQKRGKVQSPVRDPLPVKVPSDHVPNNKHKKKQPNEKWSQKLSKQNYTHQWMMTSLKGHTAQVNDMDFSSNGKYLATCAEDRVVFIWSTKDFINKDHKYMRFNIDFDHASHVCWSPDSKAFVINKVIENNLEVYKVTRKADGWVSSVTKAKTFAKQYEEETIGIGIAINGKFMMSCSSKNQMILYDLKGSVLAKVDTYLINTFSAKISPCGRFVAASGFAPDVKVWEVQYNKSGEFKQVKRAYELKGHTAGVYDFSFNADSTRMATVSKDGTWKVFDIKIEFEKGEDPHLLKTGSYKNLSNSAHLALSPNGEVLAIATGSSLYFFSTITGDCDKTISNIYNGNITKVLFDSAGDYVLTSGEKHVRVFHNVTGYRTTIASARQKLKMSGNSAATKERLENMIKNAEIFLAKIGEPLRGGG
uniref:Transducin beta-like protein 2 n=1 Tax=Clastoptera arizonana TaxID=38151 RepID=A0A1B6D5Z2_9HEMI